MTQPIVLVVGGGIGALCAAAELLQAGFRVTLVAEDPLAQHASTKNQGWLQCGALYAGRRQHEVARHCAAGAAELKAMAPEAVRAETSSLYLFDQSSARDSFLEDCEYAGIFVSAAQPPAVAGGGVLYAVRAQDHSMIAPRILRRLAKVVSSRGGVIAPVNSLATATLTQSGAGWSLVVASGSWTADFVVLATGAMIPAMLQPFGRGSTLQVSKIAVLAIDGVSQSELFLSVRDDELNVVPYFGDTQTQNGVTVTLLGADVPCLVNDNVVDGAAKSRLIAAVTAEFPSLALGRQSRFYVCHKVRNMSNQADRNWIIDEPTASSLGLWALYPGKFTTGLLAARELVARMCAQVYSGVQPRPYSR